jgi:uncharacterized protein
MGRPAMTDLPESHGPDLDELEAFLLSERTAEDCMGLSELDGFLTAVAVGPELIMPSEWLPLVWGEEDPEFESEAEAGRIIGAVVGRYNRILADLGGDPPVAEPIFEESEAGETLVASWAMGFMEGVQLRVARWEEVMTSEDHWHLVAPIIVQLVADGGTELSEAETEELQEAGRRMVELIPSAVIAIDEHWRDERGEPRKPGGAEG